MSWAWKNPIKKVCGELQPWSCDNNSLSRVQVTFDFTVTSCGLLSGSCKGETNIVSLPLTSMWTNTSQFRSLPLFRCHLWWFSQFRSWAESWNAINQGAGGQRTSSDPGLQRVQFLSKGHLGDVAQERREGYVRGDVHRVPTQWQLALSEALVLGVHADALGQNQLRGGAPQPREAEDLWLGYVDRWYVMSGVITNYINTRQIPLKWTILKKK